MHATRTWAAGVLPVAVHPVTGAAMVLLARDAQSKGGHWSDFAGGREPEDAAPQDTALRELREETGGGLVMRHDHLRGALEFRGTTPSGKTLYRYVVRMPLVDVALGVNDEKTALAWFPLDALPPLRYVFRHQMQRDREAIRRFALAASAPAGAVGA